MRGQEIDSERGDGSTHDVHLKVFLKDGRTSETTITGVRWRIIRQADSQIIFCENCGEIDKDYRQKADLDVFSDQTICYKCYKKMNVVEFMQRVRVPLPEKKNSHEMWTIHTQSPKMSSDFNSS